MRTTKMHTTNSYNNTRTQNADGNAYNKYIQHGMQTTKTNADQNEHINKGRTNWKCTQTKTKHHKHNKCIQKHAYIK